MKLIVTDLSTSAMHLFLHCIIAMSMPPQIKRRRKGRHGKNKRRKRRWERKWWGNREKTATDEGYGKESKVDTYF